MTRTFLSFLSPSLVFLAFFLSLFGSPALAAHSDWQQAGGLSARLVASTPFATHEKTLTLGLDLRLEDGWHIYWRGEKNGGTPPSLNWEGSDNVESVRILYPAPRRMSLLGMDAIGYDASVLLPLHLEKKDASEGLTLRAALDVLACSTLCLPSHFDLTLSLPPGDGAKEAQDAALISASISRLPATQDSPTLFETHAWTSERAVHIAFRTKEALALPDAFIESDAALSFSKPKVIPASDGKGAVLTLDLEGPLPQNTKALSALPLTVTLVHNAEAREIALSPTTDAPLSSFEKTAPPQEGSEAPSLWLFLLFAVLGGFILNLMPCVLPVLSLKVLAVLKQAGGKTTDVRRSFLASATGIEASFLILAFLTIALRASGQAFGWGVHFQQPVFLVFMIALLVFFAANLFGFFTLSPSLFLTEKLATPSTGRQGESLWHAFATGAFATLLATPCSAPFLGTAVGFALAAPWPHVLAIFSAMGLGMALPYLILALWPRVATALPKPGHWMKTLTRFLGLGLLATALWLLSVLRAQTGFWPFALIGAAMAGIFLALYLRYKNILRPLTLPVIGLALACCLALATLSSVPLALQKNSGAWTPFDEAAITRAVNEGKIVFVDVTADWCLTCKYNKRVVLGQDEIATRLFQNDAVVAQQADWTTPDPAITAFLHRHGVYGIPFNIVFGPRAPKGIALPEILSREDVLMALEKAKACPSDSAC